MSSTTFGATYAERLVEAFGIGLGAALETSPEMQAAYRRLGHQLFIRASMEALKREGHAALAAVNEASGGTVAGLGNPLAIALMADATDRALGALAGATLVTKPAEGGGVS